jgi:hypothetical protein
MRQVEEVITLAARYMIGLPQHKMQEIKMSQPLATAETLWIMCNTEHVSDKVLYQSVESEMGEGLPREASVHFKTQRAISILKQVEKNIQDLAMSRLAKHFTRDQRQRLSGGSGPLPSSLPTLAAATAASSSASSMLGQGPSPPK